MFTAQWVSSGGMRCSPLNAALGENMDDDRTTKELIEILGTDYEYFHGEIISRLDEGEKGQDGLTSADFQFEARQLVRAAFAYIEAVTFSVKVHSAMVCDRNDVYLSDAERNFIGEIQFSLNDKGEVVERAAQIKLTQNIRFAFNLLARSRQIESKFDPSTEWWSCLRSSIRVRDRLMHPRLPVDLDISIKELLDVMKAKHGFDQLLMEYP